MLQAEKTHRAHVIVEQVIADLKSGALAELPSGAFAANSAWPVLAAIAFNLTRAAGTIASVFHTSHHRDHPPAATNCASPTKVGTSPAGSVRIYTTATPTYSISSPPRSDEHPQQA